MGIVSKSLVTHVSPHHNYYHKPPTEESVNKFTVEVPICLAKILKCSNRVTQLILRLVLQTGINIDWVGISNHGDSY